MRDKSLYLWQTLDQLQTALLDLGEAAFKSYAKNKIANAQIKVSYTAVERPARKRRWINNTRAERHASFMNNRLFFILATDNDENDDPGTAAAPGPDPLPSGGFDGIFVGTPESVELLAMAVLA